jgi:hypothetical protein
MKHLLLGAAAVLLCATPAMASCANHIGPAGWFRPGGYCEIAADLRGANLSAPASGGFYVAVSHSAGPAPGWVPGTLIPYTPPKPTVGYDGTIHVPDTSKPVPIPPEWGPFGPPPDHHSH